MKILTLALSLTFSIASLHAQDQSSTKEETSVVLRCGGLPVKNKEPLYVIDGVLLTGKEALKDIFPKDIVSIQVLRGAKATAIYGTQGGHGVVIIKTTNDERASKDVTICQETKYPFKIYCIPNRDWVLRQDVTNALQANVPSLQIQNNAVFGGNPSIRLRGNDVNFVIVDGVRYDPSILNFLNPNDIETIKVAPSVGATNYFINGTPLN